MKGFAREAGLTIRAAITGWGPTVRLVVIVVTVTVCVVAYRVIP